MNGNQLLYFLIVIYVSLACGVYIKFRLNGIRGKALAFAPFMPVLSLILAIWVTIDLFRESDNSIKDKLIGSLKIVNVTLTGFPILVGLTALHLSKRSLKPKPKQKNKNKPGIFNTLWPSYRNYYSSHGISTKARLV